jgi:hypothetical protein
MKFELSAKQFEELRIWREKIIDLHGKVGIEQFTFQPTGIGETCIVKNISYGIELDITHEEEW